MSKKHIKPGITIGIPYALHLVEDHDFWTCFFSNLGIKTISSRNLKAPVKYGKTIAGAEFCAPVVALHGHVKHLLEKSDYVFLPFYFEDRPDNKHERRQHCYYTQFSPSIIRCVPDMDIHRLISPVVKYLYTGFHTKLRLYKALKNISDQTVFSFFDISTAYETAIDMNKKRSLALKNIYSKTRTNDSLNIVFLGRPYTILSETMNNNIPQLFERLNVKTFFQDMLDLDHSDFTPILISAQRNSLEIYGSNSQGSLYLRLHKKFVSCLYFLFQVRTGFLCH